MQNGQKTNKRAWSKHEQRQEVAHKSWTMSSTKNFLLCKCRFKEQRNKNISNNYLLFNLSNQFVHKEITSIICNIFLVTKKEKSFLRHSKWCGQVVEVFITNASVIKTDKHKNKNKKLGSIANTSPIDMYLPIKVWYIMLKISFHKWMLLHNEICICSAALKPDFLIL